MSRAERQRQLRQSVVPTRAPVHVVEVRPDPPVEVEGLPGTGGGSTSGRSTSSKREEAVEPAVPTFLFIHGYGSSSYMWRHWLHGFLPRGRVLLLDMKGFGKAPKPDDDRYSPFDLAEAVADFIVEHDLRRLTIVGQSLGGGVALVAALSLHDEGEGRLDRMVLLAPAAYRQPLPPFVWLSHRPRLTEALLRLVGPRRILRWTMRSVVHDPDCVTRDQIEEYARAWRTAAGRRAALAAGRQIVPPGLEERTSRYRELGVPTFLLWGDDDPVVPLWVGRRLEREMPRARLVVLEGCGHMPTDEAPRESLTLVERFLERNRVGTGA